MEARATRAAERAAQREQRGGDESGSAAPTQDESGVSAGCASDKKSGGAAQRRQNGVCAARRGVCERHEQRSGVRGARAGSSRLGAGCASDKSSGAGGAVPTRGESAAEDMVFKTMTVNYLCHPTTSTYNMRISSSFTLRFSFSVSSFNVCHFRFGGVVAAQVSTAARALNPCIPRCCQRLEMLRVLWLLVLVHLLP